MTENGIAGKTWRALKRTASGLGSGRKTQSGEPRTSKSSTSGTRPPTDNAVVVDTLNGHRPSNAAQAADRSSTGAELQAQGPRGEFLQAYDAATLAVHNRIFGENAGSLAEASVQQAAPWNQRPGYLDDLQDELHARFGGHLTDAQEEALSRMRQQFPESRHWHTDHDILRFLRAREFDLEKTKEMYAKYIDQYRGREMIGPNPVVRPTHGPLASGLDLVGLYPARDPALTARLEKLLQWFLHTAAFGVDRDGRPVVYFRPADIVRHSMNKHVPLSDRLAFQSSANETVFVLTKLASQRAGFHIEDITQILDLSGMSAFQMVSHMRSADAQHEWQHNMDFVPEVLHRIFIINAPSGMSTVWKVASYFVPAQTKRKVTVLGASFAADLDAAIGKQNMPSCYGGAIAFEWQKHRPVKELRY